MFDPLSNFKLNKILSAVNALPTTLASSFTEVKNAIAGVQNTTNTINETTNSISGTVGAINTNINTLVAGRVVKSVQRGKLRVFISRGESSDINISNVNVDKSLLIINIFNAGTYNNDGFTYTLYSDYIRIYSENKSEFNYVSWQVIEFY